MGIQVIGGTSGAIADVDSGTKALKTRLHPTDVLGSYQVEAVSGSMAAGLAAGSTVFSVRWGDASKLLLLRRLAIDARVLGTAFTAGATLFELIVARSFTASDTGGTAITLTGNNQKRRTSFATSVITDARISSTAALGLGTRTKDAQALCNIRGHVSATATSAPLVSAGAGAGTSGAHGAPTSSYVALPIDFFKPDFGGEWPIVCA